MTSRLFFDRFIIVVVNADDDESNSMLGECRGVIGANVLINYLFTLS